MTHIFDLLQKPERLDKVMQFISKSNHLTSSDIIKFVMDQPDFHEFGIQKDTNFVEA